MVLKSSQKFLAATALALVISPVLTTAASAQYSGNAYDVPPPPPPGGYQDRDAPPPEVQDAQQGYPDVRQGYAASSAQDYAEDVPPPPGYDGSQTPPPPPGYLATPADIAQHDRDQRYAEDAQAWARDNCVKSHNNAATGAIIGGVLGALLGNGLSGRHDRGAGTFAGAAVGAVGGAAIGSSSGSETSLGCPPGYVVRREAPAYAYANDYDYAAPGWYQPWVFIGGSWDYRPYPYHSWYYRTYRPYFGRPGFGWHGGYRGGYGGGYRGGYGRGGGWRH